MVTAMVMVIVRVTVTATVTVTVTVMVTVMVTVRVRAMVRVMVRVMDRVIMKKSELLKKLSNYFYITFGENVDSANVSAKDVLSIVEEAGMLPPGYESKPALVNDSWIVLYKWEPE